MCEETWEAPNLTAFINKKESTSKTNKYSETKALKRARCLFSSSETQPMIIAVNTRMLQLNKMEGIGYFAFESFKRIVKLHPEHEFVFIFDRPYDSSFIFSDNIKAVYLSPAARHPILWYIWYEWSLARFLKKLKPDIFVSPDGYLPLSIKSKTLAVIHDINFEHYPEDLPFFNRIYYRYFFSRFAKKATRISTVSEFSKKDISETYNISDSKIDVVYNGAGEEFKPVSENKMTEIRARYSLGKPYFIFIGSLHRRKNIANLLKAFDIFQKDSGAGFKILLAGTKRWWTEDMEQAYQNMTYKADVIFTGRVSDSDLQELTASAFALTYVSLFEGFGIPIIEAFRCDVPVITSNTTSMPEIAADAAYLVDPFSVEEIAKAMKELYQNEALKNKLIEKGRARKMSFNWDKTAEDLWQSMMKACKSE